MQGWSDRTSEAHHHTTSESSESDSCRWRLIYSRKRSSHIGKSVLEALDGTQSHNHYQWSESLDPKDFNNQPALRTELDFEDLELEASKDERVKKWKLEGSDWSI